MAIIRVWVDGKAFEKEVTETYPRADAHDYARNGYGHERADGVYAIIPPHRIDLIEVEGEC